MSTTHLEPMTEDEMYALGFSPEELCEEPAAEEPEVEYHCPVCHATELQYAMHYRGAGLAPPGSRPLRQSHRSGRTGIALGSRRRRRSRGSASHIAARWRGTPGSGIRSRLPLRARLRAARNREIRWRTSRLR